MAKKKHVVNVCRDFTHKSSVGALVVDGKEIAPAKETVTKYEAGTKILFHNKQSAVDFCKFHGFDKVLYQGLCEV